MEIKDTQKTTASQLAEVLGISKVRVHQLARDERFEKTKRGQYDLASCVQAYIKYVKAEDSNSRTRLYRAQAEKHELDVAEKKSELASVSDLLTALMEIFSIVSTQLDGMSGRLASELAGISDARLIRQRLLDESRRIRTAAADQIKQLARHWRGDVKSVVNTATTTKKKRSGVGKKKQSPPKGKRRARTNAPRKNAVGNSNK